MARRALVLLLRACGYHTDAVGSAEEALRLLEVSNKPAVALVDLDLPGMSGLDFISRLEEMDRRVVPILITAAGEDRVGAAVDEKAISYMQKPVDFERLLTLLSEKQKRQ